MALLRNQKLLELWKLPLNMCRWEHYIINLTCEKEFVDIIELQYIEGDTKIVPPNWHEIFKKQILYLFSSLLLSSGSGKLPYSIARHLYLWPRSIMQKNVTNNDIRKQTNNWGWWINLQYISGLIMCHARNNLKETSVKKLENVKTLGIKNKSTVWWKRKHYLWCMELIG